MVIRINFHVVDTYILIYGHDRSAGIKHERAREVIERRWSNGKGVLGTHILEEICIHLPRKVQRPLSVDET